MKLEPSEFRDPGAVVEAVASQCGLRAGDVHLVLVKHPSTEQLVERIMPLDPEDLAEEDLSEVLYDAMCNRLGVPERTRGRIEHAVMTIIVRRGPTVFGAAERRWFMGWRYSNHNMQAFSGDVTLVTEHGWTDFMSDLGGDEPRLIDVGG